jgi:1-acyl-sn-glycerol-3-phosphate acyltransferase
MSQTIFNTPFITPALRIIAILMLKLSGWRLSVNKFPNPPFVMIAAPHTSNWDFILMIIAALNLRLKIHWMGKHTIFKQPFSGLMKWIGGIPINRKNSHNVVKQTVAKFKDNPELIILIPPEGTRKKVSEWKYGFYRIAREAKVPIILVGIDGDKKELKLLDTFYPSGDFDLDLPLIKQYYQDLKGVNAEFS